MAKPGPARKPNLQIIREGNPGGHSADRLEGGLRLTPARPPEPRWQDWWPPVRKPTAAQLDQMFDLEWIEGSLSHVEEDGKRLHLARVRKAYLEHREIERIERAQDEGRRARKVARETWRRIVAILDAEGLLTELDGDVLAELCRTVARIDQCERDLARNGLWVQGERGAQKNPCTTVVNQLRTHFKWLVGELGLSPVARDKLSTSEGTQDGGSPFD